MSGSKFDGLTTEAEGSLEKLNELVDITGPYIVLPEHNDKIDEIQIACTNASNIKDDLREALRKVPKDQFGMYTGPDAGEAGTADRVLYDMESTIRNVEGALDNPDKGRRAAIADAPSDTLAQAKDVLAGLQEWRQKNTEKGVIQIENLPDDNEIHEKLRNAENISASLERESKGAIPLREDPLAGPIYSKEAAEKQSVSGSLKYEIKRLRDAQRGQHNSFAIDKANFEEMFRARLEGTNLIDMADELAQQAAQFRILKSDGNDNPIDQAQFAGQNIVDGIVSFYEKWGNPRTITEMLPSIRDAAGLPNPAPTTSSRNVSTSASQQFVGPSSKLNRQFTSSFGPEHGATNLGNLQQLFNDTRAIKSQNTDKVTSLLTKMINALQTKEEKNNTFYNFMRDANQKKGLGWENHADPMLTLIHILANLLKEIGIENLRQLQLEDNQNRWATEAWVSDILNGAASSPVPNIATVGYIQPTFERYYASKQLTESQANAMAEYSISPNRNMDLTLGEITAVVQHCDQSLISTPNNVNVVVSGYATAKQHFKNELYELNADQQKAAALFMVSTDKAKFADVTTDDVAVAVKQNVKNNSPSEISTTVSKIQADRQVMRPHAGLN